VAKSFFSSSGDVERTYAVARFAMYGVMRGRNTLLKKPSNFLGKLASGDDPSRSRGRAR
jgi:hypothetical protein